MIPELLVPNAELIVVYNTTQRHSSLGNRERHIRVLRDGMLSETAYYRSYLPDQTGVWVLDLSDEGKEKFFVHSRIESVRETLIDDLL